MILIDKQLTRPDGGKVPSGSVIEYKSVLRGDKYRVSLTHWIDKEKKFMPISKVNNFNYVTFIDSNTEMEVKNYIDSKIGCHYTKII